MRTALPLIVLAISALQSACAQAPAGDYVPVISRTPITQSVLVPREVCVNEPAGGYYRNNFRSSETGDIDLSSPRVPFLLKTSLRGLADQVREQERKEQERRAQPPSPPPPKQPNVRPPRDEPSRGWDRGRDHGRNHHHHHNPPRTVFVPVPVQPSYPSYVPPRGYYSAPAPVYVQPPVYVSPPAYYAPAPQPTYVRKCYTQNEYVTQTVGFEIVYEYLGQRYKGQVASDPGNYVALKQGYFQGDVSPTVYPEGSTQKPTLLF